MRRIKKKQVSHNYGKTQRDLQQRKRWLTDGCVIVIKMACMWMVVGLITEGRKYGQVEKKERDGNERMQISEKHQPAAAFDSHFHGPLLPRDTF